MALERRNPLPQGQYLISQYGADKIRAFESWLKANASAVKMLKTQVADPRDYADAGQWWYFETNGVKWEGPGLPDIATPALLAEYNELPQEGFWSTVVKGTAEDIKDAAKIGGTGLLVAGGVGLGLWLYLKGR